MGGWAKTTPFVRLGRTGLFYYKEMHDISSFNTIQITFTYFVKNTQEGDKLVLQYYDTSLHRWKFIKHWLNSNHFVNNKDYTPTVTVNKNMNVPFTTDFRLRFKTSASKTNSAFFIDEIRVLGK